MIPLRAAIAAYTPSIGRRDLVAGLTVALFTIPQAMAYALIAGFPPMVGIYTAVAASILGALFGSSAFLINGPTNAISVMLAANVAIFAANGDAVQAIVLLTLMIGGMQMLAAALKVGSFTRFVSEPVLTGFTAGAGVYIVINQLPPLLGLEKSAIVADLWGWTPPRNAVFDLVRAALSLDGVNPVSMSLGVGTVIFVRALQRGERRLGRRLPAPFLAILALSVFAWAFGLAEPEQGALKVRIVSDIAPLTRQMPRLAWPGGSWDDARALLGPAFAIGLMGAVEAIAIGKALAMRAGHGFDATRQLLGEGVCNVGAAMVGGFASSGSFSRSMVNFEAGAVTRASCVLSGFLVLLIVLLFAPAANYIPITALAGTLVHIGWKLVDVARIQGLLQTTFADRLVLLVTFSGVLLFEHLETALFAGIGVAIVSALKRAEGFKLTRLAQAADGTLVELPAGRAPPGPVVTVNLQGEMFFAAAEVLAAQLEGILAETPFVVLRVQDAYNMDATTADALAHVARKARDRGGRLILSGVRPGMYGTLERAGLLARIGTDAVFCAEPSLLSSTQKAIAHARALAAVRATGACPA